MSAGSYSIIYMYGYNAHTQGEREKDTVLKNSRKLTFIRSFVPSFRLNE